MFKFDRSALEPSTWIPYDKKNNQICFWGRSNVGKSSLLNALVNSKISFVSKNPGRTKLINYFVEDNNYIVDLPGYGFANMSKNEIQKMNDCVEDFLINDGNKKEIFILVDSRLGLTPIDIEKVNFVIKLPWKFNIIYTKVDKLNQKQKSELLKKHNSFSKVFEKIDNFNNYFLTSSEKNLGIDDLNSYIYTLFYK